MNVPFLKALVIPSFANYPDYFGVTALAQQNMIMKFSFSVGAIQMALGSLISIKKKIAEKNLSWGCRPWLARSNCSNVFIIALSGNRREH